MTGKRSSIDGLARQSWAIFAVLVLFLISGLALYVVDRSHRHREAAIIAEHDKDLRCIADYENAVRNRSVILTELSQDRNKLGRDRSTKQAAALRALRELTLAARQNPPPSRARSNQLLDSFNTNMDLYLRTDDAFNKADNAYNEALAKNPIPPPVFNCSDRLGPSALLQPRTSTETVTRTATTTRGAPTVTVTPPGRLILLPGGTTTVERVQTVTAPGPSSRTTVTRTVSLPSCLQHPLPPCVLGLPR